MTYTHLFTGEPVSTDQQNPAIKSYRILLVDDEPSVLSALKRVFRQENYEVVTSNDPKQALDLLSSESFQVIISDYMMPAMNGGELLKQARALHPAMIRIMLTGHADVNAVISAMKAGAVYKFILKPWNDDDLRVTVALALQQFELMQKNSDLQRANQEQTKEIQKLAKFNATSHSQLAILLNKHGLLSNLHVQELVRLQQQARKEPMIKLIVERGWLAEKAIHDLIGKELMIQQVNLDEF
ncbi:MAG: response regulator, partial [Burkholderiaceae bacterium]